MDIGQHHSLKGAPSIFIYFLLVVPVLIFPMENSGRFPQEKPAATDIMPTQCKLNLGIKSATD